jgi:hypothetical protein
MALNSIVIKFEFHIEIVFQNIKFEKKLFNQETLKERAARQISPIFTGQISLRAMR